MNLRKLLYGALFLSFCSCSGNKDHENQLAQSKAITKDIMSFLTYREENIHLYKEFTALDSASRPISKEAFLQSLTSGAYLPLRLPSEDSTLCYQLARLDTSADPQISETIKYWAIEQYAQYKVEGKELPDFDFTDLEGNRYTKANTRGKILVLKCWFLDCLPCRKEIPHLNELKQQYKDQEDILFVSVCLDPKSEVKDFLTTTPFTYANVPDRSNS